MAPSDLSTAALLESARAFLTWDPEASTRASIAGMIEAGQLDQLQACFAEPLEFGTAGLRGTLGPGPAHMNLYVVERTTAALCRHLIECVAGAQQRGLSIGYDARHRSREFALAAARVALGQGLGVHLFAFEVPTPVLAFAVQQLAAAGGVMITASHNPAAYNGYKVYNSDGVQITTPDDALIGKHIAAISDVSTLPRVGLSTAGEALRWLDQRLVADYLTALRSAGAAEPAAPLSLAYTPLHGVGGEVCLQALHDAGFSDVYTVESQRNPDPDFPTVRFPNPEEPGAMDAVMALGERCGTDLAIANDPDADRLALCARDGTGELVNLSGNELGVLLCDHLLSEAVKVHPAELLRVCVSIVSTPMVLRTAAHHGARAVQTLTGFKWICNEALRLTREGFHVVLGFEEALGFAVNGAVHDKDGIAAAVVAARLARQCKQEGRTLWDELERLSRRDGCYLSAQHSAVFEGPLGSAQIAATVDRMRAQPPRALSRGQDVEWFSDLALGVRTHVPSGATSRSELPSSNVLVVELAGGDRICIRPSGTEPKLKLYLDVRVEMEDGEPLASARARAAERLGAIQSATLSLLGL